MTEPSITVRRAVRVRHEARRRSVRVVEVKPLGENMFRAIFHSDDLEGFASLGFDDHLKFLFIGSKGEELKRDITPRRFDAAQNCLTLEFATHDGGEACSWIAGAKPGSLAAVAGPKSSIVVPKDYDWHLFAGDLTAAPAIARRLEELPADSKVIVVLLAVSEGDFRVLPDHAQVLWTYSPDAFLDAVRSLQLPTGEGFIWCAGEAGLMAQVREEFAVRRAHPRTGMRIAGYWKQDEAGFHDTLERGLAD